MADDGIADFHPQLKGFSDGSAVVAWEKEGGDLTTNAGLTGLTTNLQIATAFYDAATAQWQPMQQLTSTAGLHRSPRIDGQSETNLMLIWTTNPAGDLEGNNTNVNQLWFAQWNGSAWSTPKMFATVPYPLLNPPAGASISPAGIITWTPGQNQSPSTTLFTAVATSSNPSDPTYPSLSATNGFYVVVQEVNVSPVLPVIPNQTVSALTQMTIADTATDSNIHDLLNYFSYYLINPPVGAVVYGNGIITWITTAAQAGTTNLFTTVVSASDPYDSINPTLKATNSFTVVVTPPQNIYAWTNTLGGDGRVPANWSPNWGPRPGR